MLPSAYLVFPRWSTAAPLSCPRADLRLVATRDVSLLAAEPSPQAGSACLIAIGGQDDDGGMVEHVEYLAAGRDTWKRCRGFGANASEPRATNASVFG